MHFDSNWTRTLVTLATLLIAGAVAYGSISTRQELNSVQIERNRMDIKNISAMRSSMRIIEYRLSTMADDLRAMKKKDAP